MPKSRHLEIQNSFTSLHRENQQVLLLLSLKKQANDSEVVLENLKQTYLNYE
jgi:hypothetical protein